MITHIIDARENKLAIILDHDYLKYIKAEDENNVRVPLAYSKSLITLLDKSRYKMGKAPLCTQIEGCPCEENAWWEIWLIINWKEKTADQIVAWVGEHEEERWLIDITDRSNIIRQKLEKRHMTFGDLSQIDDYI